MGNCWHIGGRNQAWVKTLILILLMVPIVLLAQRGPIHVNGMEMTYQVTDDSITILLMAPTSGWVGIGFNSEDNILGSDLLLFHVKGDQIHGKDMFVKGFGDPREDNSLQGSDSFRILSGSETVQQTQVQFRIPINNQDPFDFKHTLSKSFWLILAFSTHDEFDHHSHMRRHIPFVFESN